MSNVPKMAPLPEFVPGRGETPFEFIVRMAPIVRAQRQGLEIANRAAQRASMFPSARALNAK